MIACLVASVPAIALVAVVAIVLPIYATLGNAGIVLAPETWIIWLATAALTACALIGVLHWIGRHAPRTRAWLDALTCGLLVAVTVNHIALFDILLRPRLDGSEPDLTPSTAVAVWSSAGFVAIVLAITLIARNGKRARGSIALACLLGSVGTLVPQAMLNQHPSFRFADTIAPDFFQLSGNRNVIHLVPDTLQSDAVAEVMDARADLRERLGGFQLFLNHVGTHPFTAPALPTLLTGTPHDLSSGYVIADIGLDLRERSVTSALANDGVRVHFVGLGPYYCGAGAASCVTASFGQLEAPRPGDDVSREISNLGLHLDLTLLRLAPAALAPQIHDGSDWIISGMVRKLLGLSRVPHPLIEDWITRFRVEPDAPPAYFFYHYIGTHRPLRWDSACRRLPHGERDRAGLIAQTNCVLEGIAGLADRLRELGVYDQTAIVISSDHGAGIPGGVASSGVVDPALVAVARATLMLKAPGDTGPFRSSLEPTSLTDVPAIVHAFARGEAWTAPPAPRPRRFFWIDARRFMFGRSDPIPADVFDVPDNPSVADGWNLLEMSRSTAAPSALQGFTPADMLEFQRGSRTGSADLQAAGGVWMTRRLDIAITPQVGADALHVRLRPFDDDMSLEVRLNHRSIRRPAPLVLEDENQWWIDSVICLTGDELVDGNNLVTLMTFGGAGRALVGDIRTGAYAACGGAPTSLAAFTRADMEAFLQGAVSPDQDVGEDGIWLGRRTVVHLRGTGDHRESALRIVGRGFSDDGSARLAVMVNGRLLTNPIMLRPETAAHWWAEAVECLGTELDTASDQVITIESHDNTGRAEHVLLRDLALVDSEGCG